MLLIDYHTCHHLILRGPTTGADIGFAFTHDDISFIESLGKVNWTIKVVEPLLINTYVTLTLKILRPDCMGETNGETTVMVNILI